LKILFDTNIILDVLLNREPFVKLSATLVSAVENKEIEGFLCATTITTLDYLISKETNRSKSRVEIRKLLGIFHISEVNVKVLELSLNSKFNDFEDAVQYYSGEYCSVNGLVTRNTKDYKQAKLPIYTPSELSHVINIKKHN
jgi:predicted nucleic acid-binding protein